ncbi:MAG TPA: zf-TFIIB domain-containing protein [Candidatus Saccharimonadales bacterium]|nr:zf-TFIIB domain-containing protein [Candidatus Saccharimonadales bacterium]
MTHGFSGFGGGAPQGGYDQPLRCPRDNELMAKVNDRNANVVIDQCPRCKGVWTDAGEMEAIVASVTNAPGFRPQPNYAASHGSHSGHGGHGGHNRRHHRTSDGIFGSFFGS